MSGRSDFTAAFRLVLALALLCGGLYSLAVLETVQVLFPFQANGSLIRQGGRVVGSRLIGQPFAGPEWFHGRPSATVDSSGRPAPYDAEVSAGSNLGPTNAALLEEVRRNLAAAGIPAGQVPPDLAESSGSGLDPDITPEAALAQVPRIAAARRIPPDALRALVRRMTRGRWLGLYGHPRVNVLELNLALQQTFGT